MLWTRGQDFPIDMDKLVYFIAFWRFDPPLQSAGQLPKDRIRFLTIKFLLPRWKGLLWQSIKSKNKLSLAFAALLFLCTVRSTLRVLKPAVLSVRWWKGHDRRAGEIEIECRSILQGGDLPAPNALRSEGESLSTALCYLCLLHPCYLHPSLHNQTVAFRVTDVPIKEQFVTKEYIFHEEDDQELDNMNWRKHLLPQQWAPKPKQTLLPGSNSEELYQQVWNECKCAASLDLIVEEHLFTFHFSTTVNPHLLGSLQPAKIACCWVVLKRIYHHSPGSCCLPLFSHSPEPPYRNYNCGCKHFWEL